jgi:hypothetical protein
MNLVQLANDLEYVPKEQLAQMSQDPNSNYPPYLVLSEIQRRTANEKAYAAAQSQPTSTVAEEVVGEFMQPQGMQAGMPPESAPTDVFSSGMSGMPASAPMQQPMQMASGGSTSYFEGGPTNLTDQQYYSGGLRDFNNRLRNQSRIDAAQTSAQTAVTEGLDAAGQPLMSSQLVNQNLEPDEMEMEMGMASGGLTSYATGNRTSLERSFLSSLGEDIMNMPKALQDRYTDEGEGIGSLDYSNIISDASWLIPGGFLATGSIKGLAKLYQSGALGKSANFLGRQGQRLYSSKIKPGPVVTSKAGKRFVFNSTQGKAILAGKNPPKILSRDFSPLKVGALGLAASPLINFALDDTYIPDNTNTDTELSQADKDFNKQMQANILANQQAQLDQNALDQKKANRMFSPTDLIQLGGTVMGARDMSELGQGIASVAGLSAQRKVNEKQAGLQARYLQAQTEKIEADIASMPLKDALASLKQINLTLKGLNEGAGDATEEQIAQLEMQRQFLQQRISKQQGYDPSMIAGNNKNVIDSYFPNAT